MTAVELEWLQIDFFYETWDVSLPCALGLWLYVTDQSMHLNGLETTMLMCFRNRPVIDVARVTCGVQVSAFAFPASACHQFCSVSSSLGWGLNSGAVMFGIFWSFSSQGFLWVFGFPVWVNNVWAKERSMKTECDYLNGWIKKNPKNGHIRKNLIQNLLWTPDI